MRATRAGSALFLIMAALVAAGCAMPQNPRWFGRAGGGGIRGEYSEEWQPAWTGSLGYRLENGPWFVEAQSTGARWERDCIDHDRGRLEDCEGGLYVQTLNYGGAWNLFPNAPDPDDWRLRAHVGAGYFHFDGLNDDDDGAATNAGAALQCRLWNALWLQLGATHYGTYSEFDRSERTYRSNLFLDLSLSYDF